MTVCLRQGETQGRIGERGKDKSIAKKHKMHRIGEGLCSGAPSLNQEEVAATPWEYMQCHPTLD